MKSVAPLSALPVGAMLQEYEITGVIGEGGFGIVYRARDLHLNRDVAIKEYMPPALATRNADLGISVLTGKHKSTFDIGLRSFIAEAKLMAQFKHPVLVDILRFWQQNQTAYMAMPFYDGPTLKALVASGEAIVDETWVRALLEPVLDGLQQMHAVNCYHRDISPDNILILTDSGSPLLLDFGAARRIAADLTQGITVILKPGYAPVEQYTDDPSIVQGPWTDIYGLAAVCRHAITSKSLVASVTRLMRDPLEPLETLQPPGFSIEFLRAIDKGLAVRPEDRPQSLGEFRAMFAVSQRDSVPRTRDMATTSAKAKADLVLVPISLPAGQRIGSSEKVDGASPNSVMTVVRPKVIAPSHGVTVTIGAPSASPATNTAHTKVVAKNSASLPVPHQVAEPARPIETTRSTDPIHPIMAQVAQVPVTSATAAGRPRTAKFSPLLKLRAIDLNKKLVAGAGLIVVACAITAFWVGKRASLTLDPTAIAAPAADSVAATPALEAPAATGQADKILPTSSGAASQTLPPVEPLAPTAKNTLEPPLNGANEGTALPALSASKSLAAAAGVQPAPVAARQLPSDSANASRGGVISDNQYSKSAAIVGTLQLDIRPWGEILINGESRGVSPPMKQLSLPEGRYDVSVTNPGSQTYYRSVEVSVGRSVSIRHEFQSP